MGMFYLFLNGVAAKARPKNPIWSVRAKSQGFVERLDEHSHLSKGD